MACLLPGKSWAASGVSQERVRPPFLRGGTAFVDQSKADFSTEICCHVSGANGLAVALKPNLGRDCHIGVGKSPFPCEGRHIHVHRRLYSVLYKKKCSVFMLQATRTRYNAEISAGSLMPLESKRVAALLLTKPDEAAWLDAIEVQNILQKKTPATARRRRAPRREPTRCRVRPAPSGRPGRRRSAAPASARSPAGSRRPCP